NMLDKKSFRLFSFSNLTIPVYQISGDRIQINSPERVGRLHFYPKKPPKTLSGGYSVYTCEKLVIFNLLITANCHRS
ncbi:MAG: hypothetical protein Q7J05_09325, partial [Paludibacter sp.]|nr:hypothetical protein [Paludibacter sp.]